ncbi:MAG: hypothetical protein CMH22_13285 [Methylophaga sp.]|uniref:DUF4126 domain-containing protein n=1 Tax=Methylophaga sp. UBA678 TaxID=1946901 RepID=UPI000C4C4E53|nr:DUF4126 domain-containing protein [Methylophaga sp. UBA678]MAX52943.1 hypothetical protein [Methylophaga sp.]|tara:strand:- start:68797 stop:69474 length:678 start_codon:yes stop_codon:yes gene_type:complete
MEAVNIIALSMGAAWASGINLYATIFMLGYMGITGNIVLPDELQILTDPMVMAAAGFMYCVEFFADKIPGVDSGWDTMHTFIRIPAGAMLAAGAVGDVSAAAELSAALLGGSLAAGSHATKAGGRLLINTSPEPVTNWGASISEDLLVIAGLWTALHHPVLFLILLVVFVALMIWLLPRLWRLLKAIFSKVGRWLGLTKTPESSVGESTTNTEDTPVKKIEHDPN